MKKITPKAPSKKRPTWQGIALVLDLESLELLMKF